MAVGLPEGPSYPRHSPLFFHYAAPWTTAESQLTASSKSVTCFLFFFSPALLRFLILLLLLMSGNVHPNPGPIFPCSLCAEYVTWRGKSAQCCICSKWVHLRCSQLSLSKFRALGSSHSWSATPAVTLWLPPRTPPTGIPPLYNLGPPLLMLDSRPTLVSKPLIPHLPILYLLPLPLHHRPLLLAVLLHLLPPLPLWLSQSSSMECWRSSTQEHWTICREILVSFSFLCCCSLYLSGTKCGQIFHSFWLHQTPS